MYMVVQRLVFNTDASTSANTEIIFSRWRMHLNLNDNAAEFRTCAGRDVAPLKMSFPTKNQKLVKMHSEFTLRRAQGRVQEKTRQLDWNQCESTALWENKMAPKKKVKRSKTQKNKPWTEQREIFAAVLSSTQSRDKPFVLVLETMALKKTANESVFSNVREEFEDMLVA